MGSGPVTPDLEGWTPFCAAWRGGSMVVDWCHLGANRFIEPFFYETIATAMTQPFNLLFQQRTRADDLAARPTGLAPTGFIFHMSRCGSTLCAQALAASPAHVVISEASPIRAVLRAALHGPATEAQTQAWLAGVINALARPRFGERRFFVKFMAADVLDLPLIRRVFPDVPWLFLYRDPLEILASQRTIGGADTMPGAIAPERLGLDPDAVFAMRWEAYQCHALAAFGRAALACRSERRLIVNYCDLVEALETRIPAHFGFAWDAAERTAMRACTRYDAKRPTIPFEADQLAKQAAGSPWRATAEAITGAVFTALDRSASRG